jgi:pimeloyl-ACP methyl ester carboxylesterase
MDRGTEVQWALGSTTVYGTVVKPEGSGPFPAVVMAAGSGPTDRDWNSPILPGNNGSARLLADALADAGFASLRYDKRASGPHAMENMRVLAGFLSMESHREEYAGAVGVLSGMSDIRTDAIFGLGNSEGTLHVLNYQLENPEVPLAGIILAAPPGRSVGAVARAQLAAQAAAVPNGEALLALYDEAVGRFMAGQAAEPDAALPDEVKHLIFALESPANLPFSRELWAADAPRLLADVTVPTLVIIGKKDIQVDWQVDGEPIEAAAQGHPDVTVAYPDNVNHILKYEPQERAALNAAVVGAGYNAEGAKLDPETLQIILDWLGEHLSQPNG